MFICFVNSANSETLESQLRQVYVDAKNKYHISAISSSFNFPDEKLAINMAIGNVKSNENTSINYETLFRMGSITKTFVALLVLNYVKRNQISLDDKIGNYLPEYPKWKNITIRQLLNQTSGIDDYCHSRNWWNRVAENKTFKASDLIAIAYQRKARFSA